MDALRFVAVHGSKARYMAPKRVTDMRQEQYALTPGLRGVHETRVYGGRLIVCEYHGS